MIINGLHLDDAKLVAFCKAHRIVRLSLFGSILSDQFRPESDVDFLAEFDPTAHVGLFAIAAIEMELEKLVGRKVDLRTPGDLSDYFRDGVMREARPLYAA